MRPVSELQFLGGHVTLDFLNTAEGRDEPGGGDALKLPEHLRAWGQRRGLLSPEARRSSSDRQELSRALEARELLYGVFSARAHGREPAAEDLGRLSKLVAAAHRAGELTPGPDGRIEWRWSPEELASVRHVVVHAASALLAEIPAGRLKQCPGERCGWLFLDTTKRGNRRWCSMEECGREAKVARRRSRHAAAVYRSEGESGP